MELRKDRDLFEEVLDGNKDSFRILFIRYYRPLCLYADIFLSSLGAAEDVVQTIFINIWENRERFHHVNSIKSYLYQSVRNSCYNVIKQKAVEDKSLKDLRLLQSEEETQEIQEREEKIRKLHHAISELPSKTRQALKLSIFGNFSYEEISKKMDISINTVKYHIKTAYQFLRKINIS